MIQTVVISYLYVRCRLKFLDTSIPPEIGPFKQQVYSTPISNTPLKIRRKIRFFLSKQKICPVRIAGQYTKSKTDNELKTDLQLNSCGNTEY